MDIPVIETRGLTRDYGDNRAVDGVTVTITRGRVVALLGPNGAGKSTLLKLLQGLMEPTAGEAVVFGESVRTMGSQNCSRIVSMIDGHEPPAWASMKQLIGLQAAASPAFDRHKAEALLFERGLTLRHRYGRLSKGQRRHALTSVCMATGADLMFFDEPADGLDTDTRRDFYDHVRQAANDYDATVLLATHHIHDIERLADDVMLMVRGRIILHESLETLREQMREVTSDAADGMPALMERTEIIREDRRESRVSRYVRIAAGCDHALAGVPNGHQERHIDLETMYLAFTKSDACVIPIVHKDTTSC